MRGFDQWKGVHSQRKQKVKSLGLSRQIKIITLYKCRPGVFLRTENKNFGLESAIFITTCFSKSTFHNKVYTAQEALYNFWLKALLTNTAAVFLTHFTCILTILLNIFVFIRPHSVIHNFRVNIKGPKALSIINSLQSSLLYIRQQIWAKISKNGN